MKKTLATLTIAAAMLLAAPAATFAADGGSKIGVVDTTRIMKESDAAKGIFKELEAKRAEYEKQIKGQEDSLRKAEQDITAKKSKMSEDEFNKARKDFEEKLMSAQKMVQDRKKTLDDALAGAVNQLREKSAKITADIAKERGYDVVVTQDAVVLAQPELDVTDEVVKRLNADVKHIDIKW